MQYIFLLFILLLVACSPRYEIKANYILPTDTQGKTCVKNCLSKQEVCKIRCNARQDECLVKARESVKENFSNIINAYKEDLREYEDELRQYYLELNSWKRKIEFTNLDLRYYRDRCRQDNKYECNRANEIRDSLHHLEYSKPIKPQKPTRPSLASEIQNAQRICSKNCDCKDEYNSCFSSCGGTIQYERFCVENCK